MMMHTLQSHCWQAFLETQNCGHDSTTADAEIKSRGLVQLLVHPPAHTNSSHKRIHSAISSGASTGARSWGLWGDSSTADSWDFKRDGYYPRQDPHQALKHHSEPKEDLPQVNTKGVPARPRTSPNSTISASPTRVNDDEATMLKSPPQRVHSRMFAQSAKDLDLSRGGLAGTPETLRHPDACLSYTSARPVIGDGSLNGRMGHTQLKIHPATSAGDSRLSSYGGVGNVLGGDLKSGLRPASVVPAGNLGCGEEAGRVPMSRSMCNSVVSCEVPWRRMWDKRQMKAAVAAATWERERRAPRRKEGLVVSKGGVAIDERLAKAKNSCRVDLMDTAERAKLPGLE